MLMGGKGRLRPCPCQDVDVYASRLSTLRLSEERAPDEAPNPSPFHPPRLLTDTAVRTRKARRTLAAEPVDAINTDASVIAARERVAIKGPLGWALPPTSLLGRHSPGQRVAVIGVWI